MVAPLPARRPQRLRGVRVLRVVSLGLLGLGALSLLAFLLPLWFAKPSRIVTVSAETQKIEIVFLGPAQSWTVGGARLCAPGIPCEDGAAFGYDKLDWRACDRAEIERSEAAGGVLIRPSFPLADDAGTVLFLDDASFRINGVQAFTGYVRIGDGVQSGRSTQLLSGDFTFYERDPLSRLLLRWNPDDVQSGSFRHGDQVSVVRREALLERLLPFTAGARTHETACPAEEADRLAPGSSPQEVVGHLGPPPDPAENPGLLATVTSTSGNVGLNVLRRGLGQPLTLRPDWINVVIASPAFLALTLILTYLASILQSFVPANRSEKDGDER